MPRSALLADSGAVTFLKGWEFTGNFTLVRPDRRDRPAADRMRMRRRGCRG